MNQICPRDFEKSDTSAASTSTSSCESLDEFREKLPDIRPFHTRQRKNPNPRNLTPATRRILKDLGNLEEDQDEEVIVISDDE